MNDAIVRQRTRELVDYLGRRLNALLAGRRADIAHTDPELASAFALHLMLSMLNHNVQLQPAALGLADERLPGELSRAVLAYLGGAPHP
jgi:hypothetical protein